MNEEIDESEFYQQDFTTASEWEIFIARIEEIVNQWHSEDQSALETSENEQWNIRLEPLTFADVNFYLYYYRKCPIDSNFEKDDDKPIPNPIDNNFDFDLYNETEVTNESCLASWYGIKNFIVLVPDNNHGIKSESRIKILLSSITIAASNLNCEIPMFIQIQERWQRCFLGIYEGENIRTNFEMVHLMRGPQHCQYLTGLIELFKNKIMSPCVIDPIDISVQFTYILSDFGNFVWKQEMHTFEMENLESDHLNIIPFGVTVDPISSISLKTSWFHIADHLVVDSESYSDFDPLQAQKWSCLIKRTKNPLCLLADGLNSWRQLLKNSGTVHYVLGDFAPLPTSQPTTNPLDLLTEPAVPTISTLLNRAAGGALARRKGDPPIPEQTLVPLLYFLFPDADENSLYPYGGREDKENMEKQSSTQKRFVNLEEECKGIKSCGVDSLVWRLALVLMHAVDSLGGVRAFAHIWYEFAQEMRYRWEKSMPIPGLAPGFPDLRSCLLNQKLQMLNCCIERKLAREKMQTKYESPENSSTEEEEFFECWEKPEEENKKYSLWNQPVGRLGKFGDLKLLKTGDPLYIPITQEPVLKTEDQLEEDTDVLMKLGSNAEASELRARIMSASLLSDMESFKAANPGAVVEDFIRWYSPRDWIEEEELDEWGQKKGRLSARMMIEDSNIWVQTWQSAKPVPAGRQKRLFDDTREAEKVLQFLDYRSLSQICQLMTPVISHVVLNKIASECQQTTCELPKADLKLNSLIKHVERISRETHCARRFEAFIQEVEHVELTISEINSLEYKLNPSGSIDFNIAELVANLVSGKEVEIVDKSIGDVGSRILSMFGDMLLSGEQVTDTRNTGGLLPPPYEREFVMRLSAVRPAVCSAKCPQFLRAILNKDEFRLVGAFSEDISFF